jgi:hypothetical protein
MIDLERSLGELAERLEIPGGDSLVSSVVHRIGEPARRPAHRRVVRLAGALVAVVVVGVVVLPGPRRAVARWLGFDSVRIEPGVTLPTTTLPTTTLVPTIVTAVTTTVAVPDLDLDPPVSIDEAMSRTGLPDPTPALLGNPQSIHVVQPPEAGEIVVVYSPSDLVPQSAVTGVGALVSVMPAKIDEGLFGKTLGNATVRAVDVGGADGFWIEGSPHQLFFQIGDEIEADTLRLATNTLLWERDGHVYRIEADVSLDTALQIAASVA